MKPDYSSVKCLDVLIMGGYYSKGMSCSGRFSHFLVGVRSDDNPELWCVERGSMAARVSPR